MGEQKKVGHIHLLGPFLSVSKLLAIVFRYWRPLILSMATAKVLIGLEITLFPYPSQPGSGRALPLISRLGMPHHFLLVSSNTTHNFLNSFFKSLQAFFFFWVHRIFCVGTLTETTLNEFLKASHVQYLENWDYYFNSTQEYFFSLLVATRSITHSNLKPWIQVQMFILVYLYIQLT